MCIGVITIVELRKFRVKLGSKGYKESIQIYDFEEILSAKLFGTFLKTIEVGRKTVSKKETGATVKSNGRRLIHTSLDYVIGSCIANIGNTLLYKNWMDINSREFLKVRPKILILLQNTVNMHF